MTSLPNKNIPKSANEITNRTNDKYHPKYSESIVYQQLFHYEIVISKLIMSELRISYSPFPLLFIVIPNQILKVPNLQYIKHLRYSQ